MLPRHARSCSARVPAAHAPAAAAASAHVVRTRRMRAAAAACAAAARRSAQARRAPRCNPAHGARAASASAAPSSAAAEAEAFSEDVVSGHLRIRQGAGRGAYRFGLDALLLATDLHAAGTAPGAQIIELGAAHGVVALCVATRFPDCHVLAYERQPSLMALMVHNAAVAGLAPPRFVAMGADVRCDAALPRATAALVLANPPFFPAQPSMVAGGSERVAARHELHGGLDAFVIAAASVLAPRGLVKLVLPPPRLPDLVACLRASGLALRSLRFVHAGPAGGAHLFEATAGAGGGTGGGCTVAAPLYVRGADGRYTLEAARRIAGAALPGGAQPTPEAVEAVRATCRRASIMTPQDASEEAEWQDIA